MAPHKTLDAALLSCWTIHAGGEYDKEAFKKLQRFVDALPAAIELKIAEAVAAEREACASIVENADTPDCGGWTAQGIADAIRLRSNAMSTAKPADYSGDSTS